MTQLLSDRVNRPVPKGSPRVTITLALEERPVVVIDALVDTDVRLHAWLQSRPDVWRLLMQALVLATEPETEPSR